MADPSPSFHFWWMNDNHTFVALRSKTLDDTLAHTLTCWERSPHGMLCGYYPKPDERHLPGQVHGHGRGSEKRALFETEARAWLGQWIST